MGFFKSLKRGIGHAVEKIGEGVSSFGNWIGSEILENTGNSMRNFGNKLAGKIGSTTSYDDSSVNIRQTEQISVMLAEFSKDIEQSADKMQVEIEGAVRLFFDGLNRMVEDNHIDLPRRTIYKEQKDALRSVDGFLKQYVAKRVSLDDRECLHILKMSSGSDKEQAMISFTDKVLQEGRRKLCDRLKDAVCDIFNLFWDAFTDMMDDKAAQLKNAEEALDSLQDDTPSRERTQAQAGSILSGIYLVDQLLPKAERA